jgi:sugar phosphate isomerase/epimerase
MKFLAAMAEDGGVTLVHENCSGWGGQNAENSTILLGEVASPALKLVFDTGNPVDYGQNAWDYYRAVLPDIVHVHIKDARRVNGEVQYVYCGEGNGHVQEILADLARRGYPGDISIEPHIAAVIHTGKTADSAAQLYDSYIQYGRRLMALLDSVTSAHTS